MKPTRSSPVSTIIGWQPISFQHFSHLPLSPQSYFQAQLIYHIILPINISVRTSERWLFENNTNIFKSLVSYYNFLKRNVSCEALLYCYLCSPWKHRYMNSNHGYLQEQPLCGSPFPECFPRIIQCYSCINHQEFSCRHRPWPRIQLREVKWSGQDATDMSPWLI